MLPASTVAAAVIPSEEMAAVPDALGLTASGRPFRNRKAPTRFGQFVAEREEENQEGGEKDAGENDAEEPPKKRGRVAVKSAAKG